MLLLPLPPLLLLLLGVPKAPVPHADVGDWWALYDYGLEAVSAWPGDYQHPYPGGQRDSSGVYSQFVNISDRVTALCFKMTGMQQGGSSSGCCVCQKQLGWALYDYGLEAANAWPGNYQHPYPGGHKTMSDIGRQYVVLKHWCVPVWDAVFFDG